MTSATDVLDLVRNTVRIVTWKVSLDGVSSETRIAIGRIRFLAVPRAGGPNFAFFGGDSQACDSKNYRPLSPPPANEFLPTLHLASPSKHFNDSTVAIVAALEIVRESLDA